ncbi:sugar transferase [Panacibacter ginsenosidivorans]|uniref:Sugar transferase n=1 Tax=Panacibacter ginsenosidivorans TaxID=1813871 RepID=A0A5B8VCS3_9BACT|nr:sugar transferase [Panacibacter ginsenosidivorans]QEC69102.1 sugar transferase [Panacibacter ginsenosidivorans]
MLDATRFFDILIACLLLVLLSPLFLIIGLVIKISSKGPVIFQQRRVGKNDIDFTLYKFRTMYVDTGHKSSITIGNKDSRVTRAGYFLRKYKMDELPQLYNVLKNDMSIVGPRPELRKYVTLYTAEQKEILLLKPGITDYASIHFRHESELLATQKDPEAFYIKEILPLKIQLNKQYAFKRDLRVYFVIIFNTLLSVFK